MCGKRRRLGMTVARNSASNLSYAKATSASVRKTSIASSLSRKLAVSSTWNSGSATLPCGRAGLHSAFDGWPGVALAALLEPCDGDIRVLGASRNDVFQPAPGIVDQQQVDSLALQVVVVVQPVGIDEGHIALTILGDDLLGAGLHMIGKLGQVGTRLSERHHVAGRDAHDWPLCGVTEFCAV